MNSTPLTSERRSSLRHSVRMVSLTASFAAVSACSGFAFALTQEAPQGRLARPGSLAGSSASSAEIPAVDGRPAEAGRIPEGTSAAASDLWNELTLSLKGNAQSKKSSRSFELEFNGRIRTQDGSNDYTARFGYLDLGPGLVRAQMLTKRGEVKSVLMRGLGAGDAIEYWFRKFKGDAATDWILQTRRDHREAREDLDNYAAISYDIARIVDPASFRIVDLRVRKRRAESDRLKMGVLDLEGDPGIRLPDTDLHGLVGGREITLSRLAESLVWLELATPDFKEIGDAKSRRRAEREGPRVKRLVFGLDPKTKRPQLIIVAPTRTDDPLQVPGSLLIQCTEWFAAAPEGKPKSWIPGRFFSYEVVREESASTGLRYRFGNTSIADLYMHDTSDMNADLKREDFVPRK